MGIAFGRKVYPRVGGGTTLARPSGISSIGLSPRGRGNLTPTKISSGCSRSIPAWAGEPLFRQYQQGWNIAEANYRHFFKLVVRWLMIFDQVYSVRIHNLLRRLAQGADLLLAHGRRVTPGHHYRFLAQLVVPLCQNVPYPLPYPWVHGTPPVGNANFAWVQHFLHHLAPRGIAGFVLANGSMSSNTSGEGEIRKNIVEADLVDCIIALPGQLFRSTQIPACLWFLSRGRSRRENWDRQGETLFIDARKMGHMLNRTFKDLSEEDVERIAGTYHAWRDGEEYEDVPGFCKSATLEEIQKHGHVLTPGRYVGAAPQEDDGEPFQIVHFFKTQEGQHQLLANTSSTGVPSIARPVTYLRSIMLCLPPKDLWIVWDKAAGGFYRAVARNNREIITLATQRDALLPKLVSGEVTAIPLG